MEGDAVQQVTYATRASPPYVLTPAVDLVILLLSMALILSALLEISGLDVLVDGC